jgi:hypothetical protein
MRVGTILFGAMLLLLLAGSLLFAYSGLGDMPLAGWIALVAGVVFSLIIGIGLMALLFYSSRQGYDEPPKLEDTMNPMSTFNPAQPCRVHDEVNNKFLEWKPEWAAHYREHADKRSDGIIAWDGYLLDGWSEIAGRHQDPSSH